MKLISSSQRLKEIRSSKGYKEWRKYIIKRDGKKCVFCGSKKYIEVDHIKPLALFPELGIDKSNGRVLCKECHKKTDTFGAFSRFKNDLSIHPILAGDFLLKIQSLPQSVCMRKREIGFSLCYRPDKKKWQAGYRFAKINLTVLDDSIEDSIDKIFFFLKNSSYYTKDTDLIKENNM